MTLSAGNVEEKLKGLEEHVRFLEETVAELGSQLLVKNDAVTVFHDSYVQLKGPATSLPADFESD